MKVMVEGEKSTMAKEKRKEDFESFAMILGESMRKNVARTKGLASIVKYRGVYEAGGGIGCRILTGLSFELIFPREGFACRIDYFLAELEQALVECEGITIWIGLPCPRRWLQASEQPGRGKRES